MVIIGVVASWGATMNIRPTPSFSLYSQMWSMLHYRCIKPPKSHCTQIRLLRESREYQVEYHSSVEGVRRAGDGPVGRSWSRDNDHCNNWVSKR
jgi:hypothetical protein